jgi:hypothetical protein
MRRKEKNIVAIFVLLILLIGCREKVKQYQEPSSSQDGRKIENSMKLLSEDSAYVTETARVTSKAKTLKEKQIAILLNIASRFIKEQQSDIRKHDGLNCSMPAVIEILQRDDYKGNSNYHVFWSNMGIIKVPTRIAKVQGRYVLLRLQDERALSKKAIPEILLDDDCPDDEVVLVINELSWAVLMCKNSTKHIVVMDVLNETDFSSYYGNFSCE